MSDVFYEDDTSIQTIQDVLDVIIETKGVTCRCSERVYYALCYTKLCPIYDVCQGTKSIKNYAGQRYQAALEYTPAEHLMEVLL